MYPRFEIIKEEPDALKRKVWMFIVFEWNIVLDSYLVQSRKTKRSLYKTDEYYDRLKLRESTLKQDDVPLSDEIKLEAKQIFVDKLTVSSGKLL